MHKNVAIINRIARTHIYTLSTTECKSVVELILFLNETTIDKENIIICENTTDEFKVNRFISFRDGQPLSFIVLCGEGRRQHWGYAIFEMKEDKVIVNYGDIYDHSWIDTMYEKALNPERLNKLIDKTPGIWISIISDSDSTWACPACTFENNESSTSCSLCGTAKP